MSMVESRIEDSEAMRAEWVDRLNALVSLVKGWVESSGWQTRQVAKPVTQPGLDRYDVPLLLMERAGVEVVLSPVARTAPGTGGVVDLYLMPAYDDVVSLHFEGSRWFIHATFPPDPTAPRCVIDTGRLPLDESTINRILDAVAAHA